MVGVPEVDRTAAWGPESLLALSPQPARSTRSSATAAQERRSRGTDITSVW